MLTQLLPRHTLQAVMAEMPYPIGTVARMTGLGLDRLRVWERRCRAAEPGRGARGRLYTAAEVRRLTLLRDLLGSLVRVSVPRCIAPTLLFATPAGEVHEFGILAAGLLATGSGCGIVCLGVGLPAREIASAAGRSAAKAVVLGVAEPKPPRSVLRAVIRLARELPDGTELWVGAPAAALALLPDDGVVRLGALDGFEQELRRLGGAAAPQAASREAEPAAASRRPEDGLP